MAHPVAPCGILTFLTDFGTTDGFVAAMKGVAYSASPTLRVVDITHEIPHQDIFRAAMILRHVVPFYPEGTVHVVVVDPGVGTTRLPLAIEAVGQIFVGPDNGVLTLAAEPPRRAFQITNSALLQPRLSDTFHGRDIFSPVGARLACDTPIEAVGPELEQITEIPLPKPVQTPGHIEGEVIYADQYGNLMLNINEDHLTGVATDTIQVIIGRTTICGLKTTYGDVPIGELVVYIGSTGFLEVARREGNARHYLGAPRGTRVVIQHE